MASIRKRGKKWRVEIRTKSVYKTKSFIHRETALKWARDIEVTLERAESPGGLKLVSDAIRKYLKEVTPTKKGERWERIRLSKFLTYPIVNKRLSDIKPTDFSEWRDRRLSEVSPASVRRELGVWSGLFSVCVTEWQWISESPLKKVRKPQNSKPRDRVISENEQAKLTEIFGQEGPLGEAGRLMQLAIETGMRLSEMIGLNVDRDVFSDFAVIQDSKNNESRKVPLTKRARELIGNGFTISTDYASRLFRETARKAKIQGVKFHDTRHTAATRLARKLDVLDLCRMFGWRDPRHAMVYYNPHASELARRLETA
jgi:integrase